MSIEIKQYNPEVRTREDFVTWAAEALHGQMRTPTEYAYSAETQELYAEDGSVLRDIFEDAIVDADRLAAEAPQLHFEKRRRRAELQEYEDMLRMMRGELPNTMVVISDFPEELMEYPGSVGGYNVERKQTFLRVLTRQDNGRIKMFSQTLDGSNRNGLEQLYAYFNRAPDEGELLGQRIYTQTHPEDQELLLEQLVDVYDEELRKQTGRRYRAGIEDAGLHINTYDFVCSQSDLVALAVRETLQGDIDAKRYNIMATLEHRYYEALQGAVDKPEITVLSTPHALAVSHALLEQEIALRGREAAAAGKSFSGCGMTSKSLESLSAKEELSADGYGNKTEGGEESYSFDSYQYCVSCQAPPGKDEKKQWCGPCGLCRSCDKKAGGKG